MQFKAGDRVRCRDAASSGGRLKHDALYTIRDVSDPFVELVGGGASPWWNRGLSNRR
jgi:hypothetical protein